MTAGKLPALVFGSLVALVAIGLIVGGGFLLWLNAAKTDDEGYFTTDVRRFESTSRAIVSEGGLTPRSQPTWIKPCSPPCHWGSMWNEPTGANHAQSMTVIG